MLKVTRNINESITIHTRDGIIEVFICNINGGQARVGVDAPDDVSIWRSEIDPLRTQAARDNTVNHGRITTHKHKPASKMCGFN